MGKKKNRGKKPASGPNNQQVSFATKDAEMEKPEENKEDKSTLVNKVEEEMKKVVEKKPVVIEKIVKIPEEEGAKYRQLKEEYDDLVKKIKELETEKTSMTDKLSKISAAPIPVDNSAKLKELTEENKTLNEKVTSYMSVLANTESLLQSLQVSVEKEEKSWKVKMAEKDAEVKQLSGEKSTLLKQIDELKATATAVSDNSSEINCLKARLQEEQEQNQKLSSQLESQGQNSTISEVNVSSSQNGIENHE